MRRLLALIFLGFLFAGSLAAYSGTSFSFSVGAGGNVNSSFALSVVANNTEYLGGCSDMLSADSQNVLVNEGGGNFAALSSHDISSRYNASGIAGTATVELKITNLGTYNISLGTSGCENVSQGTSTLISIYGGNFSGHIWNASAGTGFPGAEVRLSGNYGNGTAFTNGAGYYIFANFPHDSGYRIYVNASGYSQNESGSLTLLENESASVNFTIYQSQAGQGESQNGSISGYAFNSTSGLGAAVAISLQNSSANITNSSGQEGRYSFGGLYPGQYTIWVNASGFGYYSAIVQVAGAASWNITLNETARGIVFGIARNASSNATISSASVRIYKPGYSSSTSTASDGRYSVAFLQAGNYTVAVNATGFTSRSLAVEVKAPSSEVEFNISMFTNIVANLPNGLSCEINEQCASMHCCGGLCTTLACNVPNGGRCLAGVECEAGLFCCAGACQSIECIPLDVPAGGACSRTEQCHAGLLCCNGACKEGECFFDVEVSLEKQEVAVLGFKRVEIERKLVSNKSAGIAHVFLAIKNMDSGPISQFEMRETVPGSFADGGISGIEPAIYAMQNGSSGSVGLVWRFSSLEPGKIYAATYKIGKFVGSLGGFSSFGQRYEEEVVQKEKAARLIAPAMIRVGEQALITVKDLEGTPVANAGVVVIAPNSERMVIITDDLGVAKYVATIEGDYSYSVQGWELIESVRKTGARKDYSPPANISGEVDAGPFSLGGAELASLGAAGAALLFVAAFIVLALLVLFYYIYLRK